MVKGVVKGKVGANMLCQLKKTLKAQEGNLCKNGGLQFSIDSILPYDYSYKDKYLSIYLQSYTHASVHLRFHHYNS